MELRTFPVARIHIPARRRVARLECAFPQQPLGRDELGGKVHVKPEWTIAKLSVAKGVKGSRRLRETTDFGQKLGSPSNAPTTTAKLFSPLYPCACTSATGPLLAPAGLWECSRTWTPTCPGPSSPPLCHAKHHERTECRERSRKAAEFACHIMHNFDPLLSSTTSQHKPSPCTHGRRNTDGNIATTSKEGGIKTNQ